VVDDAAATCPFVGFWPRVGKAAVVLLRWRIARTTCTRSPCAPRIEIPIDGDPEPCGNLADGAIATASQLTSFPPELLGINRWTTHSGLLPLGSPPE